MVDLDVALLYSHMVSTKRGKNDRCKQITSGFDIATVFRLRVLREAEELVDAGPDSSR